MPSNRTTVRLATRSKVTPGASGRFTGVAGPDEPTAVDCATCVGRPGCVCCGMQVAAGDAGEIAAGSVCICGDGLVSPADSVGLEIRVGR